MIAPLLIIPVTLRYTGPERYGLWMAATSLTSMALFADLGIGNGLLTKLAQSHARNDSEESIRIVSSAYWILGVISVFSLATAGALAWIVDWSRVFNLANPLVVDEASLIIFITFGAFATNIALSLIQRIQYARQQVVQNNLWQAFGGILSILAALVGSRSDIPPTALIALVVAAPPVANALNTFFYFTFQEIALRPRLSAADIATSRTIFNLGIQFFLVSVLASVSLNSDTFLISMVMDSATAGDYAIVLRLFATLGLFVTLVGLVLWPANSSALAQGDIVWVKKTTARVSMASGVVVLGSGVLLVLVFDNISAAWLGTADTVPTPVALLYGFLASSVLLALTSPFFMVQNSVGVLRPQLVGWCLFLPVALFAKLYFIRRWGVAGAPIAGFLAYALVITPSALLGYRKALKGAVRTKARAGASLTPRATNLHG